MLFFARSYIVARREIPRKVDFMIYASCVGVAIDKTGESYKFNITTNKTSFHVVDKTCRLYTSSSADE